MTDPEMSPMAKAFVTIGKMIRELEDEIRMNEWKKLVRIGPFEIQYRPDSRFAKWVAFVVRAK